MLVMMQMLQDDFYFGVRLHKMGFSWRKMDKAPL